MNPLLDQSLFYHRFDEAVNCFVSEARLLVGTMLPQCLEEGMAGICPIAIGLQVVVDGNEGPGVQGDAPELLALADDINDGLVAVGLEIPGLEVTEFGFS